MPAPTHPNMSGPQKLTPTSPEVQTFMATAAAGLKQALAAPKDIFSFQDCTPSTAAMNALVLSGKKRATCSWPIPTPLHWSVGDLSVGLDEKGWPALIIRTSELRAVRWEDVDEDFARDEGEGDGSLAYWRSVHVDWFNRAEGGFGDGSGEVVLCERFDVVWPVDVVVGGSGGSGGEEASR